MAGDNSIKCVHLIIGGRVQGVGFRYFAKQSAQQYHINGWIRNRDDGHVEIAAEGSEDQVNQFIQIIRKGNLFIRVKSIDIQVTEPHFFTSFEIRATV